MIIGIDHLAFNTENFNAEVGSRVNNGFVSLFSEENISNPGEKKPFLKEYCSFHDLALLKPISLKNVCVEVTSHHAGSRSRTFTPYEYGDDYVTLYTSKMENEIDLLKILGFKSCDLDCYQFISPLAQLSCRLELKKIENNHDYTLDSVGYTCLALITNDLQGEIKRIENIGVSDFTNKFRICVAGRNLDVIMFRSPAGVIYELIEIVKSDAKDD